MKLRIALIQPYFGTLPNYFPFALETYAHNATIEWHIFTDDRTPYAYPPNVSVTYTTLDRLKRRFQPYFAFPIALERPYKLCDYKPLYGHLFADQIKGCDFWGYFDPDVIFGDLGRFITEQVCQKYDKLCLRGHFSLFRNTPAVNLLYQSSVANCLYYKNVLSSERNWGFGERDNGVNAFFATRNLPVYTALPIADIFYLDYAMRLANGATDEREKARQSCFAYQQGKLYRYYSTGAGIRCEEFMYIHLMRRRMEVLCGNTTEYLIYGNAFRKMEPITGGLLQSTNKNRPLYLLREKFRMLVYIRYLKPVWRRLFVDRDYGRLGVGLLQKCRLLDRSRRRSQPGIRGAA